MNYDLTNHSIGETEGPLWIPHMRFGPQKVGDTGSDRLSVAPITFARAPVGPSKERYLDPPGTHPSPTFSGSVRLEP